jgi:Uma2 family endonuclease
MSAVPEGRLTAEENLRIDREAEVRCDFYAGEMFAMAGGSKDQNQIIQNLAFALREHFRRTGRNCRTYVMDMRVQLDQRNFYVYPDVVVVCGKTEFLDDHDDTLLNPIVIVEVLFDSTEAYDRGLKFEKYRKVDSVQEYVLISQKKPLVERYARSTDGSWNFIDPESLSDELVLASLDFKISLQEIYLDVDFPPQELPNESGPRPLRR